MCCVHVPFRCARGFVCVHVPREGGKGWKLHKPWWAEDHRRGMAWSYGRMEGPRWKEKGWEDGWKRGANKKLDRVVSEEKLRGRRWRSRNTEWQRATATSTRSMSFQHVVNTVAKKIKHSVRQPRFVVCQIKLIHNKYI